MDKYPEPDSPPGTGVWTAVTKSLITVYRSFHAINVEPEEGIRQDINQNVLTVYFGSEKADEGVPTSLTQMYGKLPEFEKLKPKPEALK